jgi:hypothetical protein
MYKPLSDHGNLSVLVKRHGHLDIFRKSYPVDWTNFDQFSMAFLSKNKFNPGTELLIKLSIKDKREESVSEIVGIVRDTTKERSGNYRCGVEFDLESNENMNSIKAKKSLANIELFINNILKQLTKKKSRVN